jgi:hypothetical protein
MLQHQFKFLIRLCECDLSTTSTIRKVRPKEAWYCSHGDGWATFSQEIVLDQRPEDQQKVFVLIYPGLRKCDGDGRTVRGWIERPITELVQCRRESKARDIESRSPWDVCSQKKKWMSGGSLNSETYDPHKETECSQQCIDRVEYMRIVQARGISIMKEERRWGVSSLGRL